MKNKNQILTAQESLDSMNQILLEAFDTTFSTTTVQSSISEGAELISEEISSLKSSVNELSSQIVSLNNTLVEIQDELSNLRELGDIKDALDSIANTMYNQYNKK